MSQAAPSRFVHEPVAGPIPFDRAALDEAAAALTAQKKAWAGVPVGERIRLLSEVTATFLAVSERWAELAARAEGLDPRAPESAEEWLTGPFLVVRNLRLLGRSLSAILARGTPGIPGPVVTHPGGQVSARVFPMDLYDRLFYTGVTAEIWMEPGVGAADLTATQAVQYRRPDDGGVALVLGAGNVSSIGPMDALYKLFVENRVVLYKAHPVNDYLGPLLDEAFAPLARRGLFRQVYGGADVGAYLCEHPLVDEIHITGSDKTYEAIVFGPGPEGHERRRQKRPRLTKPVTAELGNVSPVIVVPGPWSDGDFTYHGENLATMMANNAGFNCNATRVIVQQAGWSGREKLLGAMRRALAAAPPRHAYYPGARDRHRRFLAAHPEAELVGGKEVDGGSLPWTIIPNLDPANVDEPCFTTEAFCGLAGEVALPAAGAADFLDQAVRFANERLWGTLNATLLVHPASLKEPEVGEALERAIANLRYGTVAINHWAGVGYGLVVTSWGAPPRHTPDDIQSGSGVVHNTLMFSRIEKSVLRAPFRVFPKPVWFLSHKTAHKLGPLLTRFEAAPSPFKLPGIFWQALRG